MQKVTMRSLVLFVVLALMSLPVFAQTMTPRPTPIPDAATVPSLTPGAAAIPDLTPFLREELNEIAMLTAQANYLQQQGNTQAAELVRSYIPDHQMQVSALQSFMQTRGKSTNLPPAAPPASFGTPPQIVQTDLQAHARIMQQYRTLLNQTSDPTVRQLAAMGLNGATRHFHSLNAVQGAMMRSPEGINQSLIALLTLERTAIADAQVQAAQLRRLNNPNAAAALEAAIPAHQQLISQLEAQIRQQGGNPALAVVPPVVPLPNENLMLAHGQTFGRQVALTSNIVMSMLPANSPARPLFAQSYNLALQGMAQLSNALPATGMLPGAGIPPITGTLPDIGVSPYAMAPSCPGIASCPTVICPVASAGMAAFCPSASCENCEQVATCPMTPPCVDFTPVG